MTIALAILLFCVLLMLIGVLRGKNLPERIMSLCCLNNYVIILLCFLSLFEGRESFIDIAYIYALLGFVLNVGLSKLNGNKYD
jgi:multisubunit Na+/H+ antiporter MnhF subunit